MFKKIYKDLINEVNTGDKCIVITYLHLKNSNSGSIDKKIFLTKKDLEDNTFDLGENVITKITESLFTGKIQIEKFDDKMIVIEPFFPKPRLIVFGGGHIAKPLVEFAHRVGFYVTVVDDRPYFANSHRFPEAENVICKDFKDSFNSISFKESDFVVIVTRGHRHDGLVLREVLKKKLQYIGMIGSKRRVKGMIKELLDEGYSKESLDEVYSPIGLSIGAVTPEEIAISIVAELVSSKNNKSEISRKFSYPDFDNDVSLEITKESTIPRAVLTILSSKGSVPRKAGAKMVTYLDGTSFGSIGGGCSEAEVLVSARDIMRSSGGFLIQKVDMTGEVAESLGMVCGGVMDVLIEVL